MKMSSIVIAVVALSLGACAKKAVTRVTLEVPDTFSGYVHLYPCMPEAKELAVLNDMNKGHNSVSSGGRRN